MTKSINVFTNWSQAVNEPRVKYFFAYGSPNEALKLETTNDIELGAGYTDELAGIPIDAKYNYYHISFEGKSLQILDPTKANTPGYDYKGRRYLPIGGSTYSGHEVALNVQLPFNLSAGMNMSIAKNVWGEPTDSEGAQYLYSKDDVQAGIDFTDTDSDGKWDAGELALHKDFVEKFGEKTEVGMPQKIFGGTLAWSAGGLSINAAVRHFSDIYVLENNAEVTVDGHMENGTWISDEESATLPAATVVDMVVGYRLAAAGFPLTLSVHINNLLNTEYWQKGDSYGFLPGAERTIIFNTSITF